MIRHDTHLHIGSLLFEGVDQIDLTGPFEVLSRIPNATYRIYSKVAAPVRDMKGLWLMSDASIAEAPPLDVLHVPGGYGQEALMEDTELLGWIRQQARGACRIFSVCTGALVWRGWPAQGTPSDNALVIASLAAVFWRHPHQRTCSRRWQLGLCCRRHGRHRWSSAPRGGIAGRGGRADDPIAHGVCARATLPQRYTRDGPSLDIARGSAIAAGHHRTTGRDGTTRSCQARHQLSCRRQRLNLNCTGALWRELSAYWRACNRRIRRLIAADQTKIRDNPRGKLNGG